ncbi:hypothetical protein GCM10009111_34800 [Colwellia asteriadis]|uniref:DUF4303 domain-containing protein n=1 Tax=Colwellia asteriadis TaxID=517723 RepID=A0ABP3WP68_9GAMM
MNLSEQKKHIVFTLTPIFISCIEEVKYQHSDIYAIAIHCGSGFSSLGFAASTLQHLNEQKLKHPKEYWSILEYSVSEWEFVNYQYDKFIDLNQYIDELLEEFYEEDLTDDEINSFFSDVCLEVLNKTQVTLSSNDVLLSLQFSDPSDSGIAIMKTIYEALHITPKADKFLPFLSSLAS